MNNNERSQWIDNDETLYLWWQSSGLSKRAFIKANKETIDWRIKKLAGNR